MTSWIASSAAWLTTRRLRAQAMVLALCLWSVCALDLATPGMFDRAGNIKFQDFLPFYISARMVAQGSVGKLYDQQFAVRQMESILRQPAQVRLPYLFGPQVALLFAPLTALTFPLAAGIFAALSLVIFFLCIGLMWKSCPHLREYVSLVVLSSAAYPPLFHTFIRGQISVLLLACFTSAWLAFSAGRPLLAGLALGLLACKPQFLVAIPVILLLAGAWRALAGTILSAAAQLGLTWIIFGSAVMRAYFSTLWHISSYMHAVEPGMASIQMHSLRSFWALLIPWPNLSMALYVFTSILVVILAAAAWKSSLNMAVRFSALTLAAVLVNPHLFVYDLLVLAPALLLLADWILSRSLAEEHPVFVDRLRLLTYLAFVLPLLGPLSRWTHLQLSVLAFVALLWILWRYSAQAASPQLAPGQPSVV